MKHIVIVPFLLLSHHRNIMALAVNLGHSHPDELTVTVLCNKTIVKSLLLFKPPPNVRVVGLVDKCPTAPGLGAAMQLYEWLGEEFPAAYGTIVARGTLVCAETQRQWDFKGVPAPGLVIADSFVKRFGPSVKAITPDVRTLTFFSTNAESFSRHFAPSALDGMGEFEGETLKALEKGGPEWEGLSFDDAAHKVRCTFTGKVITSADGVQFYDYEHHTQEQFSAPISFLIDANEYVVSLCSKTVR